MLKFEPVRWVCLCALTLCLSVLGACVSTAPTIRHELPTTADQTDLDRRARVRLELASAYFGRGQNDTALAEVNLALQARPDLPDALNLRGLIYASLEDPVQAEQSFKRALELSPRDADTAHNLGWFYCQQKRFAEADTMFERALAQTNYRDPQRTLLTQGVCQARNQQLALAERSLMKALELDAGNPAVGVNLAEVLYRRGDYERARFYIRRVNNVDELITAQTLWLALRIEHRSGQTDEERNLGRKLLNRFPEAPETKLYGKGRFDE
jgi:type IV pilus assembly protein PilF